MYLFLILILWGLTEKYDLFRGKGVQKLKREVGQFVDLSGEGVCQNRGFFLTHFGRQGACHDIIKSEDSQTNKIQSMTA